MSRVFFGQAYKTLARLLHPDGQSDARLKAMAECQMKRLNDILATLADSQKRRKYDESLCDHPKVAVDWVPPEPVQPAYWYRLLHFGVRNWFWILVGLAVVVVGVWCIEQSAPEAAQVVPKQNAVVPDDAYPVASGVIPPMQSTGKPIQPPHASPAAPREMPHPDAARTATRNEAAAEPKQPESAHSSSPKELPPPAPIGVVEPPRVVPEAVEPAIPAAPANKAAFAGNWFFDPASAGRADPNLYPATYVEFVLAEENGSLAGDYRAKYKIPDQAISSEVQFRVQGKLPNGKSCKLAWASDDGAQGEAELTLRSSNQMNVTWWTTVFGRRAALSSGMAVLTRQQAP